MMAELCQGACKAPAATRAMRTTSRATGAGPSRMRLWTFEGPEISAMRPSSQSPLLGGGALRLLPLPRSPIACLPSREERHGERGYRSRNHTRLRFPRSAECAISAPHALERRKQKELILGMVEKTNSAPLRSIPRERTRGARVDVRAGLVTMRMVYTKSVGCTRAKRRAAPVEFGTSQSLALPAAHRCAPRAHPRSR